MQKSWRVHSSRSIAHQLESYYVLRNLEKQKEAKTQRYTIIPKIPVSEKRKRNNEIKYTEFSIKLVES